MYSVTRKFRGATYNISIQNPAGVCTGVNAMTVNGKAVDGQVIPAKDAGSEVDVIVTLG